MGKSFPLLTFRRTIRNATKTPARAAKARLRLEGLEERNLLAVVNGDFAITNPSDPGFGWTTTGSTAVVNQQGVLNESATVTTGYAQNITVPAGTTALRFTIVRAGLVANGGTNPPDAFEAALLGANQMSLVGTAAGLQNTDAFLNVQQNGQVFFSSLVQVTGATASGQTVPLTAPLVVTVDVSGLAANAAGALQLDLLGFGPADSAVTIDDVVLLSGAAPPPLSFVLDPASDTGVAGDDLTLANPVTLVVTTAPNQQVQLDVDGDGFDDGVQTADANGRATFTAVPLAAGANALRMQATNAGGTATASRTVTLDNQPPTGTLTSPAPNATVTTDPGFVEIQWTDAGAAGLDATTFGTGDITITGVTVDRVENRGNGLVRYHYNDDGNTLATGGVAVQLVAGQVADLAGNTNAAAAFSFTKEAPPAPTLTLDLDAASDTGVSNSDNLTSAATGTFVATTQAGQQVLLDIDGDGFDDGTQTADANGRATFTGVALVSGVTTARAQATNPGGTTTAQVIVTRDALAPTGALVSPANGSTVNDDPGFVEIQWTDTGASGLDDASFGVEDVTIAGVSVDSFERLGNGRVRYRYNADGQAVASGTVAVQLVANQVGDRAGNTSPAATVSFNRSGNRAPTAAEDQYTVPAGTATFQQSTAGGLLANDTDPDGDRLTAAGVTQPANGTVTVRADGSFAYTPQTGFAGIDTFTYKVSDGRVESAPVLVRLTVPVAPTPTTPTTGLALANGLLIVPGAATQTVRLHFRWISREAAFNNEIGLFVTDGAGRINNLGPADAGYGAAGLNSPTRQVIFASGQGAGAVADISLRGGDRVAVYLAQNGTGARAAAGQVPAFFTDAAANSDDAAHARIGPISANTMVYRWEDLIRGDNDFNDVVMSATVVGEAAALLGSGVFQAAAGTAARTGVFTLFGTDAAFRNEIGFFPVDDVAGRIGGLLPADAGYAAAALAAGRAQVLFASGTQAITETERTLPANGLFGLYLVADGTTAEALRGGKTAFLSLAAANADRQAHLRADTGGAFGFEDQINLGDADYNDAVIRVGVR